MSIKNKNCLLLISSFQRLILFIVSVFDFDWFNHFFNRFVFRQSNLRCCDGEEGRNDGEAELFDPSWDGGNPLTPGCLVETTRAECHPLRKEGLARHPSAVDVGVVGTDDNVAAAVVVVVADVVAAAVGVDDVTDVANETDCVGGDRTNLLLLLLQGQVSCCCCCCC